MITTYKVDFKRAEEILRERGLLPGGTIQKYFTNEVIRISDPYVPFDSGTLKNQILIAPDATYYDYISPYARYHWYGKLMVDPITKKGAFFKPGYGYWSRPGVPKELTNIPLEYKGGKKRGPKWTDKAWEYNQDQVISNLERKLNK